MTNYKGRIFKIYEASCGVCCEVEHPPGTSIAQVERKLREYGWKNRKLTGWTCKECIEQVQS